MKLWTLQTSVRPAPRPIGLMSSDPFLLVKWVISAFNVTKLMLNPQTLLCWPAAPKGQAEAHIVRDECLTHDASVAMGGIS